MRLAEACVLVGCCACGRTNFDCIDATDAAPTSCDPRAPFTSIRLVPELNSTGEEVALELSPDELTAYFASTRRGSYEVYTASRRQRSDRFSAPTPLGIQGYDSTVSFDGLTLVLGEVNGTTGSDLEWSMRSSVADAFPTPSAVGLEVLNSAADEFTPYLESSGQFLYFASSTGGDEDLYVASLPGPSVPRKLSEVSTPNVEHAPVASPDGLTLYYASRVTVSDYEIWIATRATTAVPFGNAGAIPELSTIDLEIPNWISPDNCRLYFYSDRATPDSEFYVAERMP